MDTFVSTVQIVLATFDVVFNFWFVLVFGALGWRGNWLRNMLRMWMVVAILRVLILFNSEPLRSFFIPEPLNTGAFALTGLVLFTVKLVLQQRRRARV